VRREANCACNKKMQVQKKRNQAQSATCREVKEQGEDTATESEFSDEGEVTLPPLSLLRATLPPFSDIADR
jgi:hypothetical protein